MRHHDNNFATVTFFLLLSGVWSLVPAIENGLVRTPPMGWNSWNIFHENINETQIKQIADAMVSSGMRDAGYIYLNLDDNWMATTRDGSGNLRADPVRFPSGMKSLGDYIHSKGLKFGIYGDRGLRTCHHFNAGPAGTQSGSYGNEQRDAATFASWGVDYLKYDNCEPAPGSNAQVDYTRMRDALANSGRDIVYSICAWGFQSWMTTTGNLWRTTGDIADAWEREPGFFRGIINIIDENANLAQHAKPGAWNDPDMLQVGNRGSTTEEYRTQMSMWSIMAAPLLAGNDVRTMSQTIKDLLLNEEIIAVNQDSAGIQGRRIKAQSGLEVWSKPMGSADGPVKAVALLNRNGGTEDITVNFVDLGFLATDVVTVRDLWAKQDRGVHTGSYTMAVPSHGTGMLKVQKQTSFAVPGRIEAENYKAMSGIETGTSTAGQMHIGYINDGDWVRYQITVPQAGAYVIRTRVATEAEQNSQIAIKTGTGTLLGTLTVDASKTIGWQDWYVESAEITLSAGEQELLLEFSGTAEFLFDMDWIEILSPPHMLPGVVQAEDYSAMLGLQKEPDAQGDTNIGWINHGDWARYFVQVPETGSYVFRARIATGVDEVSQILVKNENGVVLGTMTVDVQQTNDWHDWYMDSIEIDLEAGVQALTLEFTGTSEYLLNIDLFEIVEQQATVGIAVPTPGARSASVRSITHDGHNVLRVQASPGDVLTLQIISLQGKSIFNARVHNGAEIILPHSALPSHGIYWVTLHRNGDLLGKSAIFVR